MTNLKNMFIAILAVGLVLGKVITIQAADPFKVAIVAPGSITDNGWTQAGYEGLLLAKEELGIEFAYSEKIKQPDQLEALSDYARRGYDLVIGHGGEFQDAVERVAKRHPKTMFMVNNGLKTSSNVANADFYFSQLGYLMGYTAGKMSKTGKVGIIAAQKFKFTSDTAESFESGVKAARPDTVVFVTWTGDWEDVAKGKEAALIQLDQGADVVWPTMDAATVGSLQAVKERGAYSIGIYYDAIQKWPDIMLQSAILDVRKMILNYLSIAVKDGLEGKLYKANLNDTDAMRIGSFHPDIPDNVRKEVEQLVGKMKSGELKPQPY